MAVPLTLKVYKGDELVASRDYDRDIIKIGRLSSAHLCLDDERVSRIHSVIEVSPEGQLSIIDMGSVEGTYVNGKRVNKGTIAFGDVVKVGNTTIRVENANEAAAANLAVAAVKADVVKNGSPATNGHAPAAVLMTPSSTSIPVAKAPVAAPPPPPPEALAAPEAHHEPGEPEVPRHLRKKAGTLGVALRFNWGKQMLGEFFLAPDKVQSFTVGTARGVGFTLDEPKLGTPNFELVRVGTEGFQVRFPASVKGRLLRGEEAMDLKTAIDTKKAVQGDGAYTISLGNQDLVALQLGGVMVEITLQPVPKKVWVPWQESMDFAALNIFLVIFFLFALGIITAVNRSAEGDQWADELSADSRTVKLLMKPMDQVKNPFLEQLEKNKLKEKAQAPAEKAKGDEGKAGRHDAKETGNRMAPKGKPDSKDQARQIMAKLMGGRNGGLSTLLGNGIGGELKNMMGGINGRVAGDSNGMSGLGLRGGSSGGGSMGNSIGIAGVGTRYGGNRMGAAQASAGVLGEKKKNDIEIKNDEASVIGAIDPELIRRVIHSHRDQIRYCYEMELVRTPKLAGKIKVKFVIGGNGFVTTTGVAESSVHNPTLENCIAARVKTWEFPKPKGGGVAIVSYPFVFKQSGD